MIVDLERYLSELPPRERVPSRSQLKRCFGTSTDTTATVLRQAQRLGLLARGRYSVLHRTDEPWPSEGVVDAPERHRRFLYQVITRGRSVRYWNESTRADAEKRYAKSVESGSGVRVEIRRIEVVGHWETVKEGRGQWVPRDFRRDASHATPKRSMPELRKAF
jgi:hypothetical protein